MKKAKQKPKKPGKLYECLMAARNVIHQFVGWVGAFFLAIILASALVWFQHTFHETGHYIGCVSTGFITKAPALCYWSNWTNIPLYPGVLEVPAPQQTTSKNVAYTPLVYFGGPFLSILLIIALAIYLKDRLRITQNAYWLVPLAFILQEVCGNMLCGTDNPWNAPLALCQTPTMLFFNQWVLAIFVVFPITYLLYPSALQFYATIDDKLLHAMTLRRPKARR